MHKYISDTIFNQLSIVSVKKFRQVELVIHVFIIIKTYLNQPFSFNGDDIYARPSF